MIFDDSPVTVPGTSVSTPTQVKAEQLRSIRTIPEIGNAESG